MGVAGVVGRHPKACAFLFSILLGEWTALSLLQVRVFCKGPAWLAGGVGMRNISDRVIWTYSPGALVLQDIPVTSVISGHKCGACDSNVSPAEPIGKGLVCLNCRTELRPVEDQGMRQVHFSRWDGGGV